MSTNELQRMARIIWDWNVEMEGNAEWRWISIGCYDLAFSVMQGHVTEVSDLDASIINTAYRVICDAYEVDPYGKYQTLEDVIEVAGWSE